PTAAGACALYAGFYVLVNFGYDFVWLAVSHKRRLLKASVDAATIALVSRSLVIGFVLYTFAGAVAFLSPPLSLVVMTLLWIMWTWLAVRGGNTALSWAESG